MSKWVRIIPNTNKRPTPNRYMLSSPSGGFRYEAGHVYEVSDDIAEYLIKPGLIDGDEGGHPIFEAFPTKEAALKKMAQEHGILPTMIDQPGTIHETEEVKPLDPRGTRAMATPAPRGGQPQTVQSAPRRPADRPGREPRAGK